MDGRVPNKGAVVGRVVVVVVADGTGLGPEFDCCGVDAVLVLGAVVVAVLLGRAFVVVTLTRDNDDDEDVAAALAAAVSAPVVVGNAVAELPPPLPPPLSPGP